MSAMGGCRCCCDWFELNIKLADWFGVSLSEMRDDFVEWT